MKNYTDITVLLDRSGSMSSIKTAMESSFDEFLVAHRQVPSTRLTLIQFDGGNPQDVVYTNMPVGEVPKLVIDPRGMTPLLDAFCQAIDSTGRRLKQMSESARPDQVLFIVITDGQENASKLFKRPDVAKRVTEQSDGYNWKFVYIGANQDAFAEAASFGINPNWTLNYSASDIGTRGMMRSLTSNTMSFAQSSGRARGSSASLEFTDDQRKTSVGTDPAVTK